MKKFLVFVLAMLLCLQPIAMAADNLLIATNPNAFPFTDVPKDQWYYNDVKTAYTLGLVNGKGSATEYKPDENMNYAEAIKIAACMHELHTTGKVTLANGTKNWYDTYVDYCKTNKIIAKDYNYTEKATRAGYMEIFAKALPDSEFAVINDVPDGFIPDVKMDAPYAAAVYKLVKAGIVTGADAKNSCLPDANIKRSAVAAIIARMMVKENRVTIEIPKAELDPGTLTPEDQKIYDGNKSSMEKLAKQLAETAAVETIPNSYSYEILSQKVLKSDNYFRYVIGMSIRNISVSGTEELYFQVLIRVSTDMETVEVSKVGTSITDEQMKAAGWGTRPADFGAEPAE